MRQSGGACLLCCVDCLYMWALIMQDELHSPDGAGFLRDAFAELGGPPCHRSSPLRSALLE